MAKKNALFDRPELDKQTKRLSVEISKELKDRGDQVKAAAKKFGIKKLHLDKQLEQKYKTLLDTLEKELAEAYDYVPGKKYTAEKPLQTIAQSKNNEKSLLGNYVNLYINDESSEEEIQEANKKSRKVAVFMKEKGIRCAPIKIEKGLGDVIADWSIYGYIATDIIAKGEAVLKDEHSLTT